jgi:hypothetical protein
MMVIDRAKDLQMCSAPHMAHSYLRYAASHSMLPEKGSAMTYVSRQVRIGPYVINVLARAVGRQERRFLAYTLDGEPRMRIRCEVQPPDAQPHPESPANSSRLR